MKKTVVVGHRGVGKSSLLRRWQASYAPGAKFFDLDAEIEKSLGLSIPEVFAQMGEEGFRKMEAKVFHELSAQGESRKSGAASESASACAGKEADVVIAVGGGFNLRLIPEHMEILWLRRDTDGSGRVFLDRPRLNPDLDPLAEYKHRFGPREERFLQVAHRVYTVPEGLKDTDEDEKRILLSLDLNLDAFLTLNSRHLKHKPCYENCRFEIRDDLLNPEQALQAMQVFPHKNLLYSVRETADVPSYVVEAGLQVDWDLKFPLPSVRPFILSTHEEDIEKGLQALATYEGQGFHLKLCPLVKTWDQLWQGFEWFKKDPLNRSFLPRSAQGKWAWFRLFMKGRQLINFVREDSGSALDQPTVWEWLSTPAKASGFAAVLGSPVGHSFSPAYHKNFFKSRNMPFFKVHVEKPEWKNAFGLLSRWGLMAAAVTSPLKEEAGALLMQSALNTLGKVEESWVGTNTDAQGAHALLEPYLECDLAVWGGGGVLESLRGVATRAQFYSVRSGQPREGSEVLDNPRIVVWAAPEGSLESLPDAWKPSVVVDLNYKQNSEGLIYAQKVGAQYVSGLKMFEVQAQAQQVFWGSLGFSKEHIYQP